MSGRGSRGGKKFAPNLSVAGKRGQQSDNDSSSRGGGSRGRGDGKRGRRGGRGGRGRDKPLLIQDSGIFAAGTPSKLESGGSGSSSRRTKEEKWDSSVPSGGQNKWVEEVDSEEEESRLADLLGQHPFIADLKSGNLLAPIFGGARLQDQTQTQMEPPLTKTEPGRYPALAGYFQLPEALSSLLLGSSTASTATSSAPMGEVKKEAGEESETPPPTPQHPLSRLPPGPLGKLRLRRSGKVEMVIGDVTLDLEEGCDTNGIEEVLRVEVGPESGTGWWEEKSVGKKLIALPTLNPLIAAYANTHAASPTPNSSHP